MKDCLEGPQLFPHSPLAVATLVERPLCPTLRANPFPKVMDLFCLLPLSTDFSYLLGSHNPRPIAVHAEPLPTSVFKVIIRIFYTTINICTRGRFTPARAVSCTATPYSYTHRLHIVNFKPYQGASWNKIKNCNTEYFTFRSGTTTNTDWLQ